MAIGRKEESIVLFNHRRGNTCGCPLSKCPLIPFAYPVCRHSSDTSTLWREQREIWCKPQLRFCLKSWQSRFATRRFDRFPPQARNKFPSEEDFYRGLIRSNRSLNDRWWCFLDDARMEMVVSMNCFPCLFCAFTREFWKKLGAEWILFFSIFFVKAFFPTMAVIYFVPSLSCTNICRYMIRFILFYFKLEQRICFVHSNFAWIVWKITLMHLFLKVCISVNRVDFYRERWNGSAGKLMGIIFVGLWTDQGFK